MFEVIREWKQDLFDAGLTDLVTDTRVVDSGHGVVARRAMVKIALEIRDGAQFKRLVDFAAPLGVRLLGLVRVSVVELAERIIPVIRAFLGTRLWTH